MYRRTMNQTASTLTGLAVLLALIIAGTHLPISIESEGLWMVFLFLYCYAASIAPVHILLQPRDYLSSFLLFFGMFFGIIGILFVRPEFTVMPFTSFAPDRMNQLWPLLFVTVACGAISGFHSLVSSGTTAKQLDAQQNAVKIAYAGMLLEGGLAVLALICVGAGLSGADAVRSIVIDQNNPIGAFNAGYGSITRPFLGRYGSIFSATILNAFILTTLDTATRIGRYLTEELFNISNRYIATGIIVTAAGILAFSGSSTKIWPVFGASNQLVAALALMVLTCWLLGMHKNSLVVSIPAGIMLVTTISALIIQIINFYTEGQYVLLSINIVLIILAAFLVYETYLSIRSLKIKQAAAIP